jgi:hypothetical protein
MYPESEILFPTRCISGLKGLRDEQWEELVKRVSALPETHEDSLAFCLMMIKLCKCLRCDLGSYRASLGCCTCAQRAIKGFKSSDKALLRYYGRARREILRYLESIGAEEEKAA